MTELDLIHDALKALEQWNLKATLVRTETRMAGRGADGLVRLMRAKGRTDYVIEAKSSVSPATVGATLAKLANLSKVWSRPSLLVAPYISPPVAETLRAHDQAFADTAGNAYVNTATTMIFVTGRKPISRTTFDPRNALFTPAALKIQFALLVDPSLADTPHRTIAAGSDTALGSVPGVLAGLAREGYLLKAGKHRRIDSSQRLIDDWATGYAQVLRPKTLVARYTAPTFDAWREWPVDERSMRWGGEPAAALLARYLRPGILTLYTSRLPPRFIAKERLTLASPTDRERILEVRQPFWSSNLKVDTRGDVVAPLLVYADLLATGEGRAIETAKLIREQYLDRSLEQALAGNARPAAR